MSDKQTETETETEINAAILDYIKAVNEKERSDKEYKRRQGRWLLWIGFLILAKVAHHFGT